MGQEELHQRPQYDDQLYDQPQYTRDVARDAITRRRTLGDIDRAFSPMPAFVDLAYVIAYQPIFDGWSASDLSKHVFP
jgi:hypothetical protein